MIGWRYHYCLLRYVLCRICSLHLFIRIHIANAHVRPSAGAKRQRVHHQRQASQGGGRPKGVAGGRSGTGEDYIFMQKGRLRHLRSHAEWKDSQGLPGQDQQRQV